MGFFDNFKKDNKTKEVDKPDLTSNEPEDKDLKNEVIEFIKQGIRFGFDNEEALLEAVWTVGFENEDQLDENWLKLIISEYYVQYQAESKNWTHPTDFDKLAKVFDQLNKDKIVALHKSGYTKQDGYSDVREAISLLNQGINPVGFCFYHTQDLERAIQPSIKNLYLAFDSFKKNDEDAILIGKKIVSTLNENGLKTAWNETMDQRIEIKEINWQKIPDEQPWGISRAIEYLHQSIK